MEGISISNQPKENHHVGNDNQSRSTVRSEARTLCRKSEGKNRRLRRRLPAAQAESDIEIALGDLAELALDAVLAQAGTVASGREKFGKAVTSVVQTVEKNGKTVLQQTAEMAVQQAYLTAQSIAQANAAD